MIPVFQISSPSERLTIENTMEIVFTVSFMLTLYLANNRSPAVAQRQKRKQGQISAH